MKEHPIRLKEEPPCPNPGLQWGDAAAGAALLQHTFTPGIFTPGISPGRAARAPQQEHKTHPEAILKLLLSFLALAPKQARRDSPKTK